MATPPTRVPRPRGAATLLASVMACTALFAPGVAGAAPAAPARYPSALTLTTATAPAGEATTFTVTLTSTDTRADVSGRMVSLQRRNDAGTFMRVASATTDTTGVATIAYTPFTTSVYRADFAGAASLAGSSSAELGVTVTKAAAQLELDGDTEFSEAGVRSFTLTATNPDTAVPARNATVEWGFVFDDCDRYGCDEIIDSATTDENGQVKLSWDIYASGTLSISVSESAATLESETQQHVTVTKPGLDVEFTQAAYLYPDMADATFTISVTGTEDPVEARTQRYDADNDSWEDLDSVSGLPGTVEVALPAVGRYRVVVDENATTGESVSEGVSATLTKFSTSVGVKRVTATSLSIALRNTTRDSVAGLGRAKVVLQRKAGKQWKTYKTVTLAATATAKLNVPKGLTWRVRYAGNRSHNASLSAAVRVAARP